jgi:hypothetical protein
MTNAEKTLLEQRASTLTTRFEALMVMEQTPIIQDIIAEYMAEVDRIHAQTTVKREYLYNFKTGGWNSEYALTTEQAIAQAKERFNTNDGLDIDEKSFRVSTPADYQNLLSLFY